MPCFSSLDEYGERIALTEESGRRHSYSKLLAAGDMLAAQVGRRCLSFIICANKYEPLAAYIGFLRNDIVPVLLSQSLDHRLYLNLLHNYRPAFIFLPDHMLGTQHWGNIKETCRLGNYVLAETNYEQDYSLGKDLALLLTTSGSTGSPKLVRQSYENIISNTKSIIEYLGITCEDKAITTLPMNYTYGLSIINTHIAAGASIVMTESSVMSKDFWGLLKGEGVTTFGGVPYIYEMLKKLRFERMHLPSLRYLTQAGGHLKPSLLLEFCGICRQKGAKLIVMYGQTEATARMSWLPWDKAASKSESIGVAIPGGRFWLADEQMNVIDQPGVVGELVYEGPNVTLGYAANRHDLNKGDEHGGRLFTGDMAKCDEDGFYYIVGRKKRFLKLFGSRVNLDEIEALLHNEGHICACHGADDHLLVYFEGGTCIDEVDKYLSENLGLNRSGFKVLPIDSIPRNEAGKILYSSLKNV